MPPKFNKIYGVLPQAKAYVICDLIKNFDKICNYILICQDEDEVDYLCKNINIINPALETLNFNKIELIPTVISDYVKTLYSIYKHPHHLRVIVTTHDALLQNLPDLSQLFESIIVITKRENYNHDKLLLHLINLGYTRENIAREPGEFSVRGNIIDIVPVDQKQGVRLDFFGDRLEHLKNYDLITQKSISEIENIHILPVVGASIKETNNNILNFLPECELITSSVLEDFNYNVVMHRLLDFHAPNESDLDYKTTLVYNSYQQSQTNKQDSVLLFKNWWESYDKKTPVIITIPNVLTQERVVGNLQKYGCKVETHKKWPIISKLDLTHMHILQMDMQAGFATTKFILYSHHEIIGEHIIRRKSSSSIMKQMLNELNTMEPGELVTHKQYGIGRFKGLQTIEVNKVLHECLEIYYAGDDKLFVPIENIALVSRYGSDNGDIILDKLGSTSWRNRQTKLQEYITEVAHHLLETAAQRKLFQNIPITIDHDSYKSFCDKFPYAETEDQLSAIADVEQDLQSEIPMDRLICGDVGFGKTEVAIRAAFLIATDKNPRQIAVLVPTTLLCKQQFTAFAERFKNLPIKVVQLSRLTSAKDVTAIRKGLQDGTIDIVVGTHAILNKTIKFKNLGLFILDEEHHFGVDQKEYMKKLKKNVNVMTLSATPIPRTLQMSISGLRDLSFITTPPIDRMAVKTFILEYDTEIIREAILKEKERNGQIFYVAPHIKDLTFLEEKLMTLVPEVKIVIGHGQMPPSKLDEIMYDFCNGKYDLLLSTSIIESGLDIPNVNTMIIHRADCFGLSQLYQMRGRVGRSDRKAYAYFTIPRQITENATKRLQVIQTLNTLGAGFTIASNDMDIRGYGNLLGSEQTGQVKEVGVELYQQMLEEAIIDIKNSGDDIKMHNNRDVTLNLGISVLIPSSYIEDVTLRLGIYRRIGMLKDKSDIEEILAELYDRFGPPPAEVKHFLEIMEIKLMCKNLFIHAIDAGPKGFVIFFAHDFPYSEQLIKIAMKDMRQYKLRPDGALVVKKDLPILEKRCEELRKVMEELSNNIKIREQA